MGVHASAWKKRASRFVSGFKGEEAIDTWKCCDCKQHKPIEHFSKGKFGPHDLQSYCKPCAANRKFKSRYGIDSDDVAAILEAQEHRCAICHVHVDEYIRRRHTKYNHGFVVDHDHETNTVRGMLCNSCNVGLGQFQDDIQNLVNAISYLRQNGKKI